jgi:hypothetical protein
MPRFRLQNPYVIENVSARFLVVHVDLAAYMLSLEQLKDYSPVTTFSDRLWLFATTHAPITAFLSEQSMAPRQ